ncbi:MAG: cation-transporting P-type ATPase, partial [Bacilli bacterium]|nr:cation-transporting P-type ATPase [Bacilli bacterium]
MNNMWHSIKSEEVIEKLNSSIDGISNEEALNRIVKYGKNVLPHAKKDTLLKVYLRQFINPIIYMLLLAIILSIVVGEYIDALFIGLVILLDTSLGTFQEWKSEKNAEALQKLIKVETKVLRNNKEIVLNSEDIIVGDIIIVESGDKIPADSRIISSSNLLVNEAILTGESLPSEKHGDLISEESNILERKNMLYAGTDVVRGRCKAIVVAIGIETEIGDIANRVLLTDDTESPLSIRMEKFTKQIGIFTAFIALIIAIILYYEGYILREIFFSVVA